MVTFQLVSLSTIANKGAPTIYIIIVIIILFIFSEV
jgi:hypothetical protein